ncbi:hypothetical protein LIER_21622 [Lithospermum erythrorhizon]|uniref:Uncharacterized protein n=1 Tax=Lithospermum erythrorhizon TaxID=34254 RepID=A0AAV3QTZ8_LITER
MHEPCSRRAAQDDSELKEHRTKQGNSPKDLPPDEEVFFTNKKKGLVKVENIRIHEENIIVAYLKEYSDGYHELFESDGMTSILPPMVQDRADKEETEGGIEIITDQRKDARNIGAKDTTDLFRN